MAGDGPLFTSRWWLTGGRRPERAGGIEAKAVRVGGRQAVKGEGAAGWSGKLICLPDDLAAPSPPRSSLSHAAASTRQLRFLLKVDRKADWCEELFVGNFCCGYFWKRNFLRLVSLVIFHVQIFSVLHIRRVLHYSAAGPRESESPGGESGN